ncbi:MAG TPA: RraA family protein [Alphaproteobacteria bacterium]|jgi:regulator of RNase E activity RraA
MEDSITVRLMRLDACALSDASDKLGIVACVTGLPPLSVERKIAGRVHTVKLVKKEDAPPPSGKPVHLGSNAIMASQPGEVIVVEQNTGLDAGSWGGILSTGAKMRGVAGVIASGPVRDIDEAKQMDFAVYGPRGTAKTARNRVVEIGTDVPVTIGGVTVEAGDYVLADGSAVVFIRAVDAEKVVGEAEVIARREALMAKALREGKPITEVMGADYEHMLR